jgi:hypothetical protein
MTFFALLPYFWAGRAIAAWLLTFGGYDNHLRALNNIECAANFLCAIASYALYIYLKDRKPKP